MKETGIIRKTDELGRFVIPKEIRRKLDIDTGDEIDIFVEGDRIILKKVVHERACLVTGEVSHSNVELLGGKLILNRKNAKILKLQLEQFL